MNDFQQQNRPRSQGRDRFPRRGFGGGRGFGGRTGPRQMFQAVCANCGKTCEVPFRPSGERPVYCSDCFDKQRGGGGKPRFEERRGQLQSMGDRGDNNRQIMDQLRNLNNKLDRILTVVAPKAPEAPEKNIPTKEANITEADVNKSPMMETIVNKLQTLEAKAKKSKTARKKASEKKVKE